jgi:iron complex outermembrane recepter protein
LAVLTQGGEKTVKQIQNISKLRATVAPVVLGIAMLSSPAFAQAAKADDPAEEIIVTGSRIPQPNLEGASPVTTVNAQDIKLQGVTKVEDLLNSLPQVFAGQSGTVSNGATGAATVDLRGLGPTRTLVLINGRRLMPGDPTSSAADLNSVPEALVKRVEVLTGGASSTYGADAVAGVVNFIMDRDFTGIRLDAQYSFDQHNNRNKILPPLLDARTRQGFKGFGYPTGNTLDGGTLSASLAIGGKFDDDRGHMTGYFSYRKVNAVTQDRRDYSACTLQNASATTLQCGGSSTSTPGNAIIFNNGTSTFFQIGPNRTLLPGRTRFNFAPTNYYQRPDERYTGGLFADYEISDAIKPYLEFMFMDDRSVAQIAPSGDFGNTLSINCDNPLMSAQQRGLICANENLITGFLGTYPLVNQTNSVTPGAAPINFIDPTTGASYNRAFFQLLRRNVEGGPRRADFEHTAYRGVVGSKGDLGKAWSYDAYYQYGRTLYAQTYTNEFSVSRLTNALDAVAGPGGTTICRSARTGAEPGCVPYDIFGGNITPGTLNYVAGVGFQRGVVSEQVASASFTGKLGEYGLKTPWSDAGLSVNIGAEYRHEGLELQTDQAFSTGDLAGQGAPTLPIKGGYGVKELFGEAQFPLVSEGPIYDLTIGGGYRYSKYKISNGNSFSTNTYKAEIQFAPIKDIRFRAGYNRAVRAPNLQELFAAQFVGLDGVSDPCAGFTITAANRGCLAQGLRIGQRVTGNPAGQYNGLLGGNPNLKPEISTTKSIGVIIQPSFAPKLALTIDYFDIKVDKAIQGFGADAILSSCTNDLNPLACGLIKRNPVNGSIWLTSDGYVADLPTNIGGLRTKGIDFNASYGTEIGKLGSLSLSMVGTYLDSFMVDNGLTTPYDCVGLYGPTCSVRTGTPSAPSPKWRHKARVSWAMPNGFGLSLQWRYFGAVSLDLADANGSISGPFDAFSQHIKAQNYFDLAASAKLGDQFAFRIGVNNLLDRQPPLTTSGRPDGTRSTCASGCNGNTYPAVYDALGRYIYAGITLDF